MNIILYTSKSAKNKIGKDLANSMNLAGTLRDVSSVINPVVMIEFKNEITSYNYCYIPEYKRYYFINNITSIRNGLWQIECHVDVLESFKDSILSQQVIIEETESAGRDKYLKGTMWTTKVKDKTDIKQFPKGLNEQGEFILITAGG